MKKPPFPAIFIIVTLFVVGSVAFAAQDRFTVKVPNGLAFSEFRGYETWQNVAVSQTKKGLKVIAANDAMIDAYRQGVPGDGKPFPDGSKIVKIEWSSKKLRVPLFRDGAGHPEIAFVYRTRIPRNSRTRMDGHMPSFFLMLRPTRLSPMAAMPSAGTLAIRL